MKSTLQAVGGSGSSVRGYRPAYVSRVRGRGPAELGRRRLRGGCCLGDVSSSKSGEMVDINMQKDRCKTKGKKKE